MSQPHRSSAVNYCRPEALRVYLCESPDAAAQRFDEASLLISHRIWERKDGPSRDVPVRHYVVLRKPAWADVVLGELRAEGILSPAADLAIVARGVVMSEDPVARMDSIDAHSHLRYFSDDFVS